MMPLLNRAAAFGYLDTIKQRFEAAYGANIASNVIPFAMNTDFSSVMAAETKRSNGIVAGGGKDGSASEDKIERMKVSKDGNLLYRVTRHLDSYILLQSLVWIVPPACGPLLQLATAQAGQGNSPN